MENSRRRFIRNATLGTAALTVGGILPGFSSKSYSRIMGANNQIIVSMMGVNSRGKALSQNFSAQKNCEVAHICDVDSRAIVSCTEAIKDRQTLKPKGFTDFRKSLESKDIDALVIAAPDHWHAPAALLAMQAGKHVYVEKPCSHNPHEGEMLVEAATRYKKVVQMGNQRRSWPNVAAAIQDLKNGAIGRVYFGKGWYTNNRPSIGIGKTMSVPDWLNWDLWHGPAPRKELSWSRNGYTLVSDVFPKKATASVIGIGKMIGVAVAIVADISLGAVLDTANNSGYFWAFVIAGMSYLIILIFVHLLMPKMTPLNDNLEYETIYN